ncbi:MAG TPA: 8-amino-7-oxononanoate synthase [Steroidobacteraceae bacterium]|jgi:8-amino-7-oxononanoate synthase|nr:8-amino-7-oxononanoate synthase [Steroidobacteraceae bacterium]
MQRDAAALKTALADLEQRNLKRRRRTDADGLVNFCSNDYLGLKAHPEVTRAFITAAGKYGVGSGAADLVTGHGPEHQALEEELAAFTGRERALVFSTGYMANMGVIGALADQKASIVADKLNHASLIDGSRLSGAEVRRYRHGDSAHAAELLAAASEETRLLITDGVFSMDGDVAPLPELARSARDSKAWLVVDDAHGLGVLGATGRGSCEHFGLGPDDVPVLVGTFGKAFGTFGAFVAGDADLVEFLLQKSRTYIYTTALPPAVAAATRAALRASQRESWRREKARALAQRFRRSLGDSAADSQPVTTIVPVIVGESAHALELSARLERQGFLVTPIRPPTVPPGTARLRVTLSAAHEEAQVDLLSNALTQVMAT